MAGSTLLLTLMIISTWNVHGATSCMKETADVAAFSDITFIYEHWLPKNQVPILSTHLKDDFTYIANPGNTANGVTRGGIAFIFKKSRAYSVREIKTTNVRIMSIEILFDSNKLFIVGSLLPSTNVPFYEYKCVLCEVFDLCDELSEYGPVILCGDFNTDIRNKPISPKSKLLDNNLTERNLHNVFQTESNMVTFQTKDKSIKTVLD